MTWEPPEGAKPESKSEFWRPEKEGETIVGMVSNFGESHFGPFINLQPVIHYPVDGETKGYGGLIVGLNSWLQKVVKPVEHKGKALAITYKGEQSTPAGKMRTYDVFVLSAQQWDTEKALHLKHAPDPDDTPF